MTALVYDTKVSRGSDRGSFLSKTILYVSLLTLASADLDCKRNSRERVPHGEDLGKAFSKKIRSQSAFSTVKDTAFAG